MDEAIALDSIQAIAASFGASFDAEKIVDTVLEKDGTRYYKVRWVKFSWEPAASFSPHLEHLISEFWQEIRQNTGDITFNAKKEVPEKVLLYPDATMKKAVFTASTCSSIPSIALSTLSNINSLVSTDVLPTLDDVDPSMVTHQNNEQLASTVQPFQTVISNGNQTGQVQPMEILQTLQQFTLPPINNVGQHTQQIILPCGGISLSKPHLKEKKVKVTGDPSKKRRRIPGNCPICGKLFKSTTNIAAHKKLHTEDRQFDCPKCDKKFRRKLHLTRHIESHNGIKAYTCEICGSSFSSKWYMQSHAVIHTGNKPYECTICQKKFNNKANLNKHTLIHENKRPFVCNLCGRSYRQSYDLKRHMKSHNDKKTFECTECGKLLTSKICLNRHLATHHKKKYSCKYCTEYFEMKNQLIAHCKKLHPSIYIKSSPRNQIMNDEKIQKEKTFMKTVTESRQPTVLDNIDQLYQAATRLNQFSPHNNDLKEGVNSIYTQKVELNLNSNSMESNIATSANSTETNISTCSNSMETKKATSTNIIKTTIASCANSLVQKNETFPVDENIEFQGNKNKFNPVIDFALNNIILNKSEVKHGKNSLKSLSSKSKNELEKKIGYNISNGKSSAEKVGNPNCMNKDTQFDGIDCNYE